MVLITSNNLARLDVFSCKTDKGKFPAIQKLKIENSITDKKCWSFSWATFAEDIKIFDKLLILEK
jgi:hypothetical protein